MTRWQLAGLILFSVCVRALTPASAFAAAPPNVVVIVSDDQGWGDYSFMGHTHIQTPNIDRLAREGMTFRRGYVPSSLCRPSLVSIITGLYPHQHKITSNDPPLDKTPKATSATATETKPAPGKAAQTKAGQGRGAQGKAQNSETFLKLRQEQIAYIDKSPTLPRMLAGQNYLSFQTGKWWEGNFQRGGFTDGMTLGQRHGDAGLKIGRESLQPIYDFIEKATSQQKPFFVWYAPFLPHSPHNPPERLLAKYRDKAPTLDIAKYWAMCEWLDDTCGELLGFLDQRKLTENTLVIYVTDNGWIQDPNADRYAPRSKQSPYDGGLRTPIIVKWPGRVKPQMSEHLASSLDIAPTVLRAAGLQPTAEMPGLNLLDQDAVAKRHSVHGEIFTHNAVDVHSPVSSLRFRWIIVDDWKLIVPHNANEPTAVVELFHVTNDPQELKNLAAEQPERVAAMTKQLDAWWPAK